MTTAADKIEQQIETLQGKLKNANVADIFANLKNRTTARWASRSVWITVVPIVVTVFLLRGHLTEIIGLVPVFAGLIKAFLYVTCAKDIALAICDTVNNAHLTKTVVPALVTGAQEDTIES